MTNPKILIGIVVLLIVVGIWSGGQDKAEPEPAAASSAAATPGGYTAREYPSPSVQEQPSVSPQEGRVSDEPEPEPTEDVSPGEDMQQGPEEGEQQAAIETAQRFIEGWLIEDPEQRQAMLDPLTAPALLDGLSGSIRVWSTRPAGAPTIKELAPTSMVLRQQFEDGRAVELLLALDVATESGWIVQDILPATE